MEISKKLVNKIRKSKILAGYKLIKKDLKNKKNLYAYQEDVSDNDIKDYINDVIEKDIEERIAANSKRPTILPLG